MRRFATKGYITGLLISVIALVLLTLSQFQHFSSPGPLNTGHETLACNECHEEAEGSIRQQIQANLNYLLGAREKHVAFNYESPTNTDCLACHQRENDNHPIYRFNEPRFREAREALSPQHCVSCHQEHKGVRVTSAPDNCKHCHEELIVKEDPLDVSHQQLVDEKRWDTCLQCHDFHGNHEMHVSKTASDMLDKKLIHDYFKGQEDPYSSNKLYKAKESRYENKSN